MTCPICHKPASQRYRPFCSRRCADIDLGRWLNGDYTVPADEAPEPEDLERALRDMQERERGKGQGKLH